MEKKPKKFRSFYEYIKLGNFIHQGYDVKEKKKKNGNKMDNEVL